MAAVATANGGPVALEKGQVLPCGEEAKHKGSASQTAAALAKAKRLSELT